MKYAKMSVCHILLRIKLLNFRFFVLTLNNLDGPKPENTVHVDFLSSTHSTQPALLPGRRRVVFKDYDPRVEMYP